jgi:co-chaperonin GroES (HSP10)
MSLRPLNDRVLIKPHVNPDETESGLILPETRADRYTEMQGTVVAVGRATHPRKADAENLAARLDVISGWACNFDDETTTTAATLLRDLVRREPIVKEGDDVLFSWSVGQEVTIDDERYLLMREDDLLAVLETA